MKMIKVMAGLVMVLATVSLYQNCSSSSSGGDDGTNEDFETQTSMAEFYFKSAKEVEIEVHYQAGAEPMVGNLGQAQFPIWSIALSNLELLFAYRTEPPQITIPETLEEMHLMSRDLPTAWTSQDIINTAEAQQKNQNTNERAVLVVLFVKGYYADGSGIYPNVLGVSIGGTPYVALFKDVISNMGVRDGVVAYGEQSTLVHELGHALGLVNNGVPLASPHQDVANGAHTLNPDDVMYYLNEGASEALKFIIRFRQSLRVALEDEELSEAEWRAAVALWGPETLADVEAFSE